MINRYFIRFKTKEEFFKAIDAARDIIRDEDYINIKKKQIFNLITKHKEWNKNKILLIVNFLLLYSFPDGNDIKKYYTEIFINEKNSFWND